MFVLFHRPAVALPTLFFCAFILGCGDDLPPTATVQGTVTWNGKPVECGTITFYPQKGRPATGSIQPDGSYRLTTFQAGDGAVLGRHKVTIQATRVTGNTGPMSFEEELKGVGSFNRAPTIEWLVPEQYSRRETSSLTAEVKPGRNSINFTLPVQPGI